MQLVLTLSGSSDARGRRPLLEMGLSPRHETKPSCQKKRPSAVSHGRLPHEGPLMAAKLSFLYFKLLPQHLLLGLPQAFVAFVDHLREEESCH